MAFYYSALAVFFIGTACRAIAAPARVAPPLRFRVGTRGWWWPPAPAPTEFATPRARSLEIIGRVLMHVGAVLAMFAVLALSRRSAG